jgi:hypothetical protein
MHNLKTNERKVLIYFGLFVAIAFLAGAAFFAWYPFQLPKVAGAADQTGSIAVNQDTHAARGFGSESARVDSQITLKIPNGQAPAVYQYLKEKYVGKENFLQNQFPGIHLSGQPLSDVSIFTDEYYDTPTLDLYKNQNSTRHRVRVNTTNPDDRKNGRELVQVKVTPPGQFDIRTELKYEVKVPQGFKDEPHPLIRLIAKKQRDEFKDVFKKAGINPYDLKRIFTIKQTRSRVYINLDNQNILSFSVDEGGAGILWAQGSFSSMDVGLVEVAYTEADEAKRKMLWDIRNAMLQDLQDHFPDLTVNSDSKYGIILGDLMQQIRAIPFLLKYGIL